MLKTLLARWTRPGLAAIVAAGLWLSTAACSSVSPEDLPQLESVTDRLEQPSQVNRPAPSTDTALELLDAPSVEAVEDALEDLSDAAASASEKVAETAPEVTQEVQGATADGTPVVTDSPEMASDEMAKQLQAEKESIQKKLEAANEEAAQALDAELQRASQAFDEELTKAKSRLQPGLETPTAPPSEPAEALEAPTDPVLKSAKTSNGVGSAAAID